MEALHALPRLSGASRVLPALAGQLVPAVHSLQKGKTVDPM